MGKRIVKTLAAFWIAGVVAIALASDPGTLSKPTVATGLPLLAAYGVLVGPITFVAGVHGLLRGHGSGAPMPWALLWVVLAYAGYVGLFAGAVAFRNPKLRIACLAVEAVCALVAAKGVAFCI